MSPRDATLQAMREVSWPVIGIALVLSAVFIPTAFLPGITGRLYQQFALTIVISVILSAFNALSLSPALAAKLLKPKGQVKPPVLLGKFYSRFNSVFDKTRHRYLAVAGAFIRKSIWTILALVVIATVAIFLGARLPRS